MKRVVLTVLIGLLLGGASAVAQQVPADTARADSVAESQPTDAARMDRPAADTIRASQVREELADRHRSEGRVAPVDGSGTAILADWPPSLTDLLDRMGRRAPRLLPKLDSLLVDYSYAAGDDLVDMTFGVQWQPGQTVLYRGDVMPRSEGPPDIRMSSFEIILDVVKGGRKVAETVIAVDSMALPPSPGYYEFSVRVPYEQVFLDTGPEAAERYLKEGVTLERPLIEIIGFQEFRNGQAFGDVETSRRDEEAQDEPRARPRTESAPPVTYRPRIGVLVGWRIGPNPYYVGPSRRSSPPPRPDADDAVVDRPSGDADRTGRAATAGRQTEERDSSAGQNDADAGRTGRTRGTAASNGDDKSGKDSTSSSGDGDNKDDDDDSLVPAAVGAAAAVAVVAYAGGTVGLYGSGDTPIGLTAGVTRSRGGIHLQAAINPEVIDQEGTQRLNVKLMGFYDVLGDSPVQPAASVGVQAIAVNDNTDLLGAASLGLVLNTGRFVVFGGYDFPRETPEFSISYNFRSK